MNINLREWLPLFLSSSPEYRAFLLGQLQGCIDHQHLADNQKDEELARECLRLSKELTDLKLFIEKRPSSGSPQASNPTPQQQVLVSASLDAKVTSPHNNLHIQSSLHWIKITLPILILLAFLLVQVVSKKKHPEVITTPPKTTLTK